MSSLALMGCRAEYVYNYFSNIALLGQCILWPGFAHGGTVIVAPAAALL